MSMRIETERLVLRQFGVSDVDAIYAMCRQPEITDQNPNWKMTRDQVKGFLQYRINQYENIDPCNSCVSLAVTLKDTGELVGYCGVGKHSDLPETEVAYFISRPHQNRGYATEATRAIVAWVLATTALPYVIATALTDNPASKRTAAKAGFQHEGTKRLDHCGKDTVFDYYRFYRLPQPHD